MRLALIHARLGNREAALDHLESQPVGATALWALWYPEFDTYRDDPRWQAVWRAENVEIVPGQLAPRPLPMPERGLPAGNMGDTTN
jgi:hypothetical protein